MIVFSRPPIERIAFGGIPWYALLIVAGIVIALFIAIHEERRVHLPQDTALDFALWAIPLALVGARLYYVFFQWDYYVDDLWQIFNLRAGGMAIYGALIGGVLAAYIVARRKQISIFSILDIVAPGLVLAQAIGRWGNYINMEAYGFRLSNEALQFFPFAVEIPVGSVWYWHMATFFYESVWCLLVFAALWMLRRRTQRTGDTFLLYLLFYCAGRMVIEGMRDDSLTFFNEFVRISQIFSAIACMTVVILFLRRGVPQVQAKTDGSTALFRAGQSAYTPGRILSVSACAAAFVLLFLGEFERGAYAMLFTYSQILLLVLLVLALLSVLLMLLREKTPALRLLPQLFTLVVGVGILIAGIGRVASDNTLYVSLRQLVCAFEMISSGIALYAFATPARQEEKGE